MLLHPQVFRADGANGYDLFSEEEANMEQKRSKPKRISPRMRYIPYALRGQGIPSLRGQSTVYLYLCSGVKVFYIYMLGKGCQS